MKAILHIGFPKTGTTTIQEYLTDNRSALLEQGYYVPDIDYLGVFTDLGLENAGHVSLFLAACEPENNDGLVFNFVAAMLDLRPEQLTRKAIQVPWNRKLDRIDAHKDEAHTVILSTEFLSLCVEEEIAAVREVLMRSFREVRIVVYLRRQMESLISWYAEVHKAGGYFPTFDTLLAIQPEIGENHFFNYEKVLGLWGKYFGDDNIVPRIFYRKEMAGNDLLNDFAAVAGFDGTMLKRSESANFSLPSEVIEFCRLVNKSHPLFTRDRKVDVDRARMIPALIERYATGPGNRGFHPARAQVREIIDLYRESNSHVARKYFGRDRLFDEDVSNYPEKPQTHGLTPLKCAEIAAWLWEYALRNDRSRSMR